MNHSLVIQGAPGKRYEEISFLRGFAIATIVVMHLIQSNLTVLPGFVSKAASMGGTGVHIFFFCSGFGLWLSQSREPLHYGSFLKKRMLRVYVPYILVVLLSALLPYTFRGDHFRALLSHVFLYKMFLPEYQVSFGAHFWYLSTLFQFYLLFLPLYRMQEQLGKKVFAAVTLGLSVCWWIAVSALGLTENDAWRRLFLQYLWEYALGMVTAQWLSEGGTIRVKNWVLLAVAVLGTGLAAAAALGEGVLTTFNDIPAAGGYLCIALLVYQLPIPPLKRAVEFLNQISYELYLVHILVFTSVWTLFRPQGWMQLIFGVLALALAAVAGWSYQQVLKRVF